MMNKFLLNLFLTCLFAILGPHVFGVEPPKKIALLIGVSDYFDKNMEDLRYAENDVAVIGTQLKRLGFDVTTLIGRNASKAETERQLAAFMDKTKRLENEDIAFVMFSGHGQQLMAIQEKTAVVNGKIETIKQKAETPYFCPRDAVPYDPLVHDLQGKSEQQLAAEFNLISLNQVIGDLDKKSNSRRNLLVVDACRNNPAKGKTANITGSTTRELPNGLSILFAARSGQKSWESSNPIIKHGVMSHFLIQGLKGKAANRLDQITWKRLVVYITEEVAFDAGTIAGSSERRQNPHVIDSSSNVIVLGSQKLPAILISPFGKREINSSKKAWSDYVGVTPEFKDKMGLELVLIPPGKFLMGNNYSHDKIKEMTNSEMKDVGEGLGTWSNEKQKYVGDDRKLGRPAQTRVIKRPFQISRSEVTYGLFKKFVDETGHQTVDAPYLNEEQTASFVSGGSWNKTGYRLHNRGPVTNVSGDDAIAFCKWLSKKTGAKYRLPTEIEWEYVCKSGSKSLWFFGNDPRQLETTIAKADGLKMPTVGSGKANPFGVYDMLGGAQEICTSNDQANHSTYFIRGGQSVWWEMWKIDQRDFALMSLPFVKSPNSFEGANYTVGFRVVRELE